MNVADILKKAHRDFANDTDYPESGSEELLQRVDFLNDGITEHENKVKEGIYFDELMNPSATLACGGTGSDDLPGTFLSFYRAEDEDGNHLPAVIGSGSTLWTEVSAKNGESLAQAGASPYVFWKLGSKLRTLPAASGTIAFPHMEKETRFVTGEETTEPELKDHEYLVSYVKARLYLKNNDDTLYEDAMNSANQKLDQMVYDVVLFPSADE